MALFDRSPCCRSAPLKDLATFLYPEDSVCQVLHWLYPEGSTGSNFNSLRCNALDVPRFKAMTMGSRLQAEVVAPTAQGMIPWLQALVCRSFE